MTGKSGFSTTAGSNNFSELHVHKVSQAQETEGFRHIPKYTKPIQACINPASPKKKSLPRKPSPEFELEGSPYRILKRVKNVKDIPEHLLKPPIEAAPTRVASSRVQSKGSKGGYKQRLE